VVALDQSLTAEVSSSVSVILATPSDTSILVESALASITVCSTSASVGALANAAAAVACAASAVACAASAAS
jgi:hypothetical protein